MIEYRGAFQREVLPRTLPEIERKLQRRRWNWVAPLALASAVGAVVLLVRPRVPPEPAFGVKGAPTLKLFVQRSSPAGAEVVEVRDGDALRPGDALRFEVQPGSERFLLIASVDGEGGVTMIHPAGGAASAPLPPNERFVQPGSTVLDAARGPERAFALLSREPLSRDAVKAALAALADEGAEAIRGTHSLPGVAADVQLSILWEKSPAPSEAVEQGGGTTTSP
jgi:hypothetical protein